MGMNQPPQGPQQGQQQNQFPLLTALAQSGHTPQLMMMLEQMLQAVHAHGQQMGVGQQPMNPAVMQQLIQQQQQMQPTPPTDVNGGRG